MYEDFSIGDDGAIVRGLAFFPIPPDVLHAGHTDDVPSLTVPNTSPYTAAERQWRSIVWRYGDRAYAQRQLR